MIRRPPRSTRTDTLFPYTTLFRSRTDPVLVTSTSSNRSNPPDGVHPIPGLPVDGNERLPGESSTMFSTEVVKALEAPLNSKFVAERSQSGRKLSYLEGWNVRTEERRGGKACVSTCGSRW